MKCIHVVFHFSLPWTWSWAWNARRGEHVLGNDGWHIQGSNELPINLYWGHSAFLVTLNLQQPNTQVLYCSSFPVGRVGRRVWMHCSRQRLLPGWVLESASG